MGRAWASVWAAEKYASSGPCTAAGAAAACWVCAGGVDAFPGTSGSAAQPVKSRMARSSCAALLLFISSLLQPPGHTAPGNQRSSCYKRTISFSENPRFFDPFFRFFAKKVHASSAWLPVNAPFTVRCGPRCRPERSDHPHRRWSADLSSSSRIPPFLMMLIAV